MYFGPSDNGKKAPILFHVIFPICPIVHICLGSSNPFFLDQSLFTVFTLFTSNTTSASFCIDDKGCKLFEKTKLSSTSNF